MTINKTTSLYLKIKWSKDVGCQLTNSQLGLPWINLLLLDESGSQFIGGVATVLKYLAAAQNTPCHVVSPQGHLEPFRQSR